LRKFIGPDPVGKLTPEVYVQTSEFCHRIVTITARINQREKHKFNEVRQLPVLSRQTRREILLINQFRL